MVTSPAAMASQTNILQGTTGRKFLEVSHVSQAGAGDLVSPGGGGVHTERAAPTKLCILQPDQGRGLDMGSEGT